MFKILIQIAGVLLVVLIPKNIVGQNNRIEMHATLNTKSNTIRIEQRLTYFNHSQDTLNSLYFHDWNHAFSSKKTVLGKRFVENYSKKFFFAKEKDRGYTHINNIAVNNQTSSWERPENKADFIKVLLKEALEPRDSLHIELNYTVKIPNAKYTSYGVDDNNYNLRYWHIVPVVYDKTWQLMHHLDMDDLHQDPTDYTVQLIVPEYYFLASNLNSIKVKDNTYELNGKNIQDFQLYLSPEDDFDSFKTDNIPVTTNLNSIKIDKAVKNDILNRQILFLTKHLGEYPLAKLFINKTSYDKNPLYGMNQLPGFLRPFSNTFEWDLRMFKTLTKQYIDNSLHSQSRQNTWLRNGLHTYMMMQYVSEFYPEIKLLGNLSKVWGIRSYYMAQVNFNHRYDLAYQYTSRINHDQNLMTRSDSLTNFNRLILNKFRAGVALQYLDDYLGDSIVYKGIIHHFKQNTLTTNSNSFKDYIYSHTEKDVSWFFDKFLYSDKKIDYTIKKKKTTKDSISLCIKNKRNSTIPISLYGINDEGIQSKTWFTDIYSKRNIWVDKDNVDRWILNYEGKIPEINSRNNSVTTAWSLIKKPLKIRLLDDFEAPNYTQIFLEPKADYNLYDGLILANTFKNKSLLHQNLEVALTPAYSFRSKSLTGYGKIIYHKYLENKAVNSYRFGITGSYFHYLPNLVYRKIVPYAQVFFKKKDLRSVKNRSLSLSYTLVDKEIDSPSEFDNYKVLDLNYVYFNPEIINNFSYITSLEFATKFSKLSTDIRFRKLTNRNQQIGVRLFAGVFLHNKTNSDYFSYGVNRPNDYLFRHRYYGRSETDGIFSQQIIIIDGGFKSQIPIGHANQWITSLNTSIGIWRWLEAYNDLGLVKNKNQSVYFVHDQGIRLNFVNDILEVYFPIYSNNGWEIAKPHYEKSIRFVFKADFQSIYSFLKRGFY